MIYFNSILEKTFCKQFNEVSLTSSLLTKLFSTTILPIDKPTNFGIKVDKCGMTKSGDSSMIISHVASEAFKIIGFGKLRLFRIKGKI